ncbi:hypothetical protein E2542_SST24846 [Spatholobus suberectus]|nr:hypothetical protein E2542_SST24846 [Spatholobus suberectus]
MSSCHAYVVSPTYLRRVNISLLHRTNLAVFCLHHANPKKKLNHHRGVGFNRVELYHPPRLRSVNNAPPMRKSLFRCHLSVAPVPSSPREILAPPTGRLGRYGGLTYAVIPTVGIQNMRRSSQFKNRLYEGLSGLAIFDYKHEVPPVTTVLDHCKLKHDISMSA